MANFTAQDVKKLREITGMGMMDCKKALVEADGDFDKAVTILREKGANIDKSGRTAADGLVYTEVRNNIGVILEVNTETDFVAKNEDFKKFVKECAEIIMTTAPNDIEDLLSKNLSNGNTVAVGLQEKVQQIGEKIVFRRFSVLKGKVAAYTHAGGTVGVIASFDTDLDDDKIVQYQKDITLQIAASTPKFIARDEVPADEVAKEEAFLKKQAMDEGKPENIAVNMVKGRINKLFFGKIVLMEQEFVKDDKMTIKEYTAQTSKDLGGDITVKDFVCFIKGEGIEKKQEDFASEIADMIK